MATIIHYWITYTVRRCYARPEPSPSVSGVHQHEAGEELTLENRNGEPWSENGFYRIRSGSNGSWIAAGDVQTPTPYTTTTTDACTSPTSVTLNTSTKMLTITGGKGGDQNAFQGYGVSWRDRAIGSSSWGSWSNDVMVSSSNTTATYSVSAPAGYERQFRARTIGSAGSSYYSAYVTASATLTGNTAPTAITVMLPSSSAVTRSQTPIIVLSVAADNEGDTLTLKRKIDSGNWANVTTMKGGTYYDKLPSMTAGSHTVRYKVADAYAESAEVVCTFTVSIQSWKRTIQTGSVISNATISHREDINELLTAVNTQRAFYGLLNITLPGIVGRFADWKMQMQSLYDGMNECLTVVGQKTANINIPAYPTASVINTIRQMINGTYEGGYDDPVVPGSAVYFTANYDGSVLINGVSFVELNNNTILLDGTVFSQQSGGAILVY